MIDILDTDYKLFAYVSYHCPILVQEAQKRLNQPGVPVKPKIPRSQVKKYLKEFADAKEAGWYFHCV